MVCLAMESVSGVDGLRHTGRVSDDSRSDLSRPDAADVPDAGPAVVPVLSAARHTVPGWIPLLIAAALIVADQLLKAWARTHLQLYADPISFIPGLLSFQLTYNTGAAWSLLSGATLPLAIMRLTVGLGILVYLFVRPQPRFFAVVLCLIAAGAVGNTIDGLRFGKVTDMLQSPALSAVTRALHAGPFPIFNIADSCVVGGTLLLVVLSLLPDRNRKAA